MEVEGKYRKAQEVVPVNTKAKDSFFKKVYETEERQRKLTSFLLGINVGKVSQANIRPILFPRAMSQTAVLARTVGECREGQYPAACSGVLTWK